jgi:hypothetical protein
MQWGKIVFPTNGHPSANKPGGGIPTSHHTWKPALNGSQLQAKTTIFLEEKKIHKFDSGKIFKIYDAQDIVKKMKVFENIWVRAEGLVSTTHKELSQLDSKMTMSHTSVLF